MLLFFFISMDHEHHLLTREQAIFNLNTLNVVPRGASEEQVVVCLPLSQRGVVRAVQT